MSVPYRRYHRMQRDGYVVHNARNGTYHPPRNIYERRLAAQRRNKAYKHNKDYDHYKRSNQYHNNQYGNNNNDYNDYNNHHIADKHDLEQYSGDENESVDSVKKWNKLRSQISSIYIPYNKDLLYDKYGHIMHLICNNNPDIANFNLEHFIKTITNRESQNVMQRTKLLKIEVIEREQKDVDLREYQRYPSQPTPHGADINNKITKWTLKLKITVSSPHIFQRLLSQNRTSLKINNMSFKYEVPEMYHIQSQISSLNLCIRPFSSSEGYVLCVMC